jgi:hypothetical protein
VSKFPYYNYLADAFLHGQPHLRLIPEQIHDLVFFEGRYYLYWPPFPAVLIVPGVLLAGTHFSDIFFTLLLGAINVALIAHLFRLANRRGLLQLTGYQRAWLVLFFALGTVHLTLAPYGRIWYTGQIVSFTCIALAYLAALGLKGRLAFLFTGLALAGAMLTRNHTFFAGLWPVYFLLREHRSLGLKRLLLLSLAGLLPLATAAASIAGYNWLRFGDPFEIGLDYHLMAQPFIRDYQLYGPFSFHYLPQNFYYQYLAYPFPLTQESFNGGSLFLLSPVFLGVFWSFGGKKARKNAFALSSTILLVSVPILLLMGTGWVQFGPRYSLDFTVPLLLLTSIGVSSWPVKRLAFLVVISIIHYTIGAAFLLQAMG